LYGLAINPEKKERLAEEVISHLRPDGHITAESLDKMHYLKATVQESLR
jgi:hypothetical protein